MKDNIPFDCSYFAKTIVVLTWTLLSCVQARATIEHVTLEWDPPTTRTDGSLLTDIIGYRVYYATFSSPYDLGVEATTVNSISITDLMSSLEPEEEGATYYFAVTALDDSGHESPLSEVFTWSWYSTPHTMNNPTPHWWLAQFGITNALEDVVGMDLDGDGAAVWQEYVMDSDPTDPSSSLEVLNTPCHENGNPAGRIIGCQLEWRGSTQRIYTVESSSDLKVWSPLPELENIESTSEWIVANHQSANNDPLLYRVRVRLP